MSVDRENPRPECCAPLVPTEESIRYLPQNDRRGRLPDDDLTYFGLRARIRIKPYENPNSDKAEKGKHA